MLPKSQRLTRNLERVFRRGTKLSTPFFVLRAFFLPLGKGIPRLAITVSKKASKKAVERNRIRRRLIEAVKKSNWHDEKRPMQIILLGLGEAEKVEFPLLVEEVKKAMEAIQKRYR